nr:Chain B, Protein tyrosine phosphatase and tensin homolog [unidentified]
DEDQHSQITKV